MNKIKWPLIWKTIKIDVLNNQTILLELAYRFGFKHNIFKKAQTRVLKLLSSRLLATKMAYGKINFVISEMHNYSLVKEKIQVVNELKNAFIVKSKTKYNSKISKIKDEAVQCLLQLLLIPFVGLLKKSSSKKVLKMSLLLNKKTNNFYFINYFMFSVDKFFLKKWFSTMFLKEWYLDDKLIFKTSTLFFNFILNKFENVIWKNLLVVAIKNIFVQNKIILFKSSLQFKNLIIKAEGFKSLKITFVCFFNNVSLLCNNMSFIYNCVSTKILNFFRKKGIHIIVKKLKIFNFFEWSYHKSLIIFRLAKNKLFLFKKQLKHFLKKNVSLSSYKLIVQLNCIIKNWLNVFRWSNSYSILKYLDNYLFKLCWKWALRKHFKWFIKLIWRFYFKHSNKFVLFKNRFFGILCSKLKNLKLKKKFVYVMRFQNATLLN